MNQETFHGPVTPNDFAQALMAEFDQGNLDVQIHGKNDHRIVQIATDMYSQSGGKTALSIHLSQIEDGVLVQIGEQEWLGIAASLGMTALAALRNPLFLINRLDDIGQDIASIQLSERVLSTLQRAAAIHGASHELSERLRSTVCLYCNTPNPVREPHCIACGAPLGSSQPTTCANCGYVIPANASICPQCGK